MFFYRSNSALPLLEFFPRLNLSKGGPESAIHVFNRAHVCCFLKSMLGKDKLLTIRIDIGSSVGNSFI